MPTAALIIALVGSSITVATNGVGLYAMIKAITRPPVSMAKKVHRHTTKPVYKHVLKPIGKELAK